MSKRIDDELADISVDDQVYVIGTVTTVGYDASDKPWFVAIEFAGETNNVVECLLKTLFV